MLWSPRPTAAPSRPCYFLFPSNSKLVNVVAQPNSLWSKLPSKSTSRLSRSKLVIPSYSEGSFFKWTFPSSVNVFKFPSPSPRDTGISFNPFK